MISTAKQRGALSMAKKESSSRVSPQLLREGEIAVSTVQSLVELCVVHIANIKAYAADAVKAGTPVIHMDGYTKLEDATKQLGKFATHFFNGTAIAKAKKAAEMKHKP